MELRPTSRYPSRGLSSGAFSSAFSGDASDGSSEEDAVAAVSIDGLEVVDEQVIGLSPLDAPGRRRRRGDGRALG